MATDPGAGFLGRWAGKVQGFRVKGLGFGDLGVSETSGYLILGKDPTI